MARLAASALALIVLLAAGWTTASAAPNSLGLRATYDVTANLNWAAGQITVSSRALVTNNTEEPVDALAFNLLPIKIADMTLQAVSVGKGPAASVEVTGQTISVGLPVPLGPAEEVAVTIDYEATLKRTATDHNWLFAKLNGTVTAYRWIPWLSRAVRFKRPNFGDPFVTSVSPSVRVTITSDRLLKYGTTGLRVADEGLTKVFEAVDVRDFNFSASPHYLTKSTMFGKVKVTVFYRSLSPSTLTEWAVRSLRRFGNKLGPYPYSRVVVAEIGIGVGMESPGMIWIPSSTRSSNLPYLVVHEMAHQWFYGVVGNDQAAQPFADEALAEFLTRDLLGHRKSRCAKSVLDGSIYDYAGDCYYEVIYVQGERYLNAYRQRIGNSAFWSGLRSYYETYAFRLGGTAKLLEMLDAAAPPKLAGGHEERFPTLYQAV